MDDLGSVGRPWYPGLPKIPCKWRDEMPMLASNRFSLAWFFPCGAGHAKDERAPRSLSYGRTCPLDMLYAPDILSLRSFPKRARPLHECPVSPKLTWNDWRLTIDSWRLTNCKAHGGTMDLLAPQRVVVDWKKIKSRCDPCKRRVSWEMGIIAGCCFNRPPMTPDAKYLNLEPPRGKNHQCLLLHAPTYIYFPVFSSNEKHYIRLIILDPSPCATSADCSQIAPFPPPRPHQIHQNQIKQRN